MAISSQGDSEARLAALFPGELAWCAERMRPKSVLTEAEALPVFFAEGGSERAIATFAALYPRLTGVPWSRCGRCTTSPA